MLPIFTALPAIISTVGAIADDLITTDKERIELDLKLAELELKPALAQVDVNKIEAASDKLFVAGWRPMIGWVCGVAFAYVAILEPLLRFFSVVLFNYSGAFPVIDTTITMQVLMGMLGFGMMRSFDKKAKIEK
jgi:hypothetical protein